MEHGESSIEKFEKFKWKVENFSRLETNEEDSSVSKGEQSIQLFINLFGGCANARRSNGWSRDVKFNFVVFNQLDSYLNKTIIDDSNYKFNANAEYLGYESFMTLDELHDPNKGFIVEDVCIVGVEVFVCRSTHDKPVNHMEVETISPVSTLVHGEPSKQADAELVSAALGRVLYFLKTRKVIDMNDQACKELQVLWDELNKFKFDLSWLEPHVQSALGMKSSVKKAMLVKKLRDNVVIQELETERLKTKLVAAEVNLDTERNLLKAKGLKEIDLDSELGCGSWKP